MKCFSRHLLAAGLLVCSLHAGAACSVEIAALSFGSYDTLTPAPNTSTSTVTVVCSGTAGQAVSYVIALEGTSTPTRSLRSPAGGVLNYNLYQDVNYTTVWGNGQGNTPAFPDAYTLSAASNTRSYTVYGRIPARQNVAAGLYTDAVNVTVNF
ncbi:MAG: spore coat U domain-containing protein [Betaproteobacteria bacterium]